MKTLLFVMMCLLAALPMMAQDDPMAEAISYDSVVEDDISNEAIYDWWFIEAAEGDIIVANMTGYGGLEPLIGILDPDGTLVGRSDDGTPGGKVSLEYPAPTAGLYTIVATRVGNENGTTTGEYELQVRRANTPEVRVNPYQEVVFRCQDYEVTNTVVLEFADDAPSFYRISVYGMDGFIPVIRVILSGPDITDCSRDSRAMTGDTYTLPGAETVTVPENPENAAQLTIGGAQQSGNVTLTIGSKDGATGRYLAVIEGFSITPEDDRDFVRVGQGPKAAGSPLLVYMVSDKATRLDPALSTVDDDEGNSNSTICDDAGRRSCPDVASIDGFELLMTVGDADDVTITGSRFDAGALFPTGDAQRLHSLDLSSFSANTEGGYSLILIGELPVLD